MRILAVTPQIPWPLDTGGKIRTFQLLSALARRHEVTLVSFDRLPFTVAGPLECRVRSIERVYRERGPVSRGMALARGLRGPTPYTIEQYRSAAMIERIAQVARDKHPQVLYLDSLHTAQYRGVLPLVTAVLDQHNVESQIWDRITATERQLPRRWVMRQQAHLLRRYEAEACRAADHVSCCSEEDRRSLRELVGLPWGSEDERFWTVPNGTDLNAFTDDQPKAALKGRPLVFVGSMDWAPNSDAVLWFVAEILPLILAQVPDAQFYAVGRNPPRELQDLHGKNGVSIVGAVNDVRPYLAAAALVPVPLRSGGGTRLKILEALAGRRAVVSTTLGAEGLALQPGKEIELADSAEAFAGRVVQLLRDPAGCAALADAGAAAVRQRYGWDAIGEALAERVAALGRR